ncbi:unnamed protein product, partial [Closterium sp. Yama58-4]
LCVQESLQGAGAMTSGRAGAMRSGRTWWRPGRTGGGLAGADGGQADPAEVRPDPVDVRQTRWSYVCNYGGQHGTAATRAPARGGSGVMTWHGLWGGLGVMTWRAMRVGWISA